MTNSTKSILVVLVATLCFGHWALGFGHSPTTAPSTEPASTPFAPIAYFQQSCANCHGDYGNAYGDTFGQGLSDKELRQVVKEMAEGPAFSPLTDAQLDVQTAYHRSMIDGRPFVLAWRDGTTLRGEVTPGSTVTVSDQPATVDGHTWTAPNAPQDATVTATLDKQTTTLEHIPASGAVHSHTKPVKAPAGKE